MREVDCAEYRSIIEPFTSYFSLLSDISHVIMDEVHERSIQSDFLQIIIRDLLPKR